MSYSDADKGIMYRLSDGKSLDIKNNFKNVVYTNKTFFGIIDWSKGKNVTYNGASKWEVNLTVADDF